MESIHGRASYTANIGDGIQDLTGRAIYYEINAAGIRKRLFADETDPTICHVKLSGAEVELIPTAPVEFIVRDETDPIYPEVMARGLIVRTGYVGAPAPKVTGGTV